MFQDYLDLLPQYQGVDSLAGVTCVRPFFGFVPNWIDSPLRPITSRLLHIGDAAGNRSQLSFAGESACSHLSGSLSDPFLCSLHLQSAHMPCILTPMLSAVTLLRPWIVPDSLIGFCTPIRVIGGQAYRFW